MRKLTSLEFDKELREVCTFFRGLGYELVDVSVTSEEYAMLADTSPNLNSTKRRYLDYGIDIKSRRAYHVA